MLVPIDELVLAETIRMGMWLPEYTIDMIVFGNIDMHTCRDIMAVDRPVIVDEGYDSEEEYMRLLEKRAEDLDMGATMEAHFARTLNCAAVLIDTRETQQDLCAQDEDHEERYPESSRDTPKVHNGM